MKDYYKILGVTATSSQAEIKKAYRALAIQYHPDKNNGSRASEEQFKKIADSYAFLSDTDKRIAYDTAKGYRSPYRSNSIQQDEPTPATFIAIFRKIKNQVLNAGGKVNRNALYNVLTNVLSDKTIAILVAADDTHCNSLIIDEILISCIFLDDIHKQKIYPKLLALANGDKRFITRIAVLKVKTDSEIKSSATEDEEKPSPVLIFLFVVMIISFIIFIIV